MRTQDWSPCTNPLGDFLLGQQSHQETPTAVKGTDVQELAVDIPPCTERNFAERHQAGEKTPIMSGCHIILHSSSTFVLNTLVAVFSCGGSTSSLYLTNENLFLVGSPAFPCTTKDRKQHKETHSCGWTSNNKFSQNLSGQLCSAPTILHMSSK